MEQKPGYKTTEFWTALIAQLATLAVLLGVVLPQDADTLAAALTKIAEAVILIAGQVAIIWKYIDGRTQVKVAMLAPAAIAMPAIEAVETEIHIEGLEQLEDALGRMEAVLKTWQFEIQNRPSHGVGSIEAQ